MNTKWLIVDGHNLLHKDTTCTRYLKSGAVQRAIQHIIRKVDEASIDIAPRCTIVFDGKGRLSQEPFEATHIEIMFSPSAQTADTVIERMVHAHHSPQEIIVITSDWAERDIVQASGAQHMSCEAFLESHSRMQQQSTNKVKHLREKRDKPTLGDFFPE